jgi:NAD(P)H-flavin reductase/ferredoxin
MPELRAGGRQWTVAVGSNLLDSLDQAGIGVPYSCRAGNCHVCMVRCVSGEPFDPMPDALDAGKRQRGWRLACQCRVVEDLSIEVFDPSRDAAPAHIVQLDWLSPSVLRLRLEPERALRYRAGQHVVLWASPSIARPYSLASLPGEDAFLEFHLDCRSPGAFVDIARQWRVGQSIGLGELQAGALQYDADWHERPLLLLAAGTGLAPLSAVMREAMRQEHAGPVRLIHLASDVSEHYLQAELTRLADDHRNVQIQRVAPDELAATLADLRLLQRRTMALLCGSAQNVELFAKRLYLAGLPRNQVLADAFVGR